MRKDLCRFSITVTVVALMSTTGVAQGKPDFSGTWTSSSARRPQLTISQDFSRLTITETDASLERKLVYRLDGSESRNETTSVSGEKWTHVSHAKWVSNGLVITTATTRESIGRPWEWLTIYSLEAGTGNLKVGTLDAVLRPGPYMDLSMAIYSKQ